MSFGRYLDSAGGEHFPAQITASFGRANVGPAVGPIVLTEIMYRPEPNGFEFVELRNITSAPVALFDETGFAGPWRLDGLAFTFPGNITLPPGGLAVLAATNAAAFRARYAVPDSVPVMGPFTGTLQDDGELLAIQRSDLATTNELLYITVDDVAYRNQLPWPAGANGDGLSLQRKSLVSYGNDPSNWVAASPTPGSDYIHLTDPRLDSDGDGMSNVDEVRAGTDPADPGSYLKIDAVTLTGTGTVSLSFRAIANKTYTVERASAAYASAWTKLAGVSAQPSTRLETVTDSSPGATRFYRLVTPGQP
jgi:hypothetical protein